MDLKQDMRRYSKTEPPIFILSCVLCFQRRPFRFLFYFTAAGVKCRVETVKRLHLFHHSADYILLPLESLSPFWLF